MLVLNGNTGKISKEKSFSREKSKLGIISET